MALAVHTGTQEVCLSLHLTCSRNAISEASFNRAQCTFCFCAAAIVQIFCFGILAVYIKVKATSIFDGRLIPTCSVLLDLRVKFPVSVERNA